jgi:hypothetical protein
MRLGLAQRFTLGHRPDERHRPAILEHDTRPDSAPAREMDFAHANSCRELARGTAVATTKNMAHVKYSFRAAALAVQPVE